MSEQSFQNDGLSIRNNVDTILLEVEQAMARLETAQTADSRKCIRAQVKVLLDKAERIRSAGTVSLANEEYPISTRSVTKTEQIILLRGSYLNGSKFPPWTSSSVSPKLVNESKLDVLFEDDVILALSEEQQSHLKGWYRPTVALPPPSYKSEGSNSTGTNGLDQGTSLVQDAITDCSVVASLSAGPPELLTRYVYPCFDTETRDVQTSPAGKYIIKFNINGTWRKVLIDDRLPVSSNDKVIHVVDALKPKRLWPALLEKAYLKVRGGYDFPGSNSSTDLWVLTGWIPEQILLTSDDIYLDQVWERLWRSYRAGNVMITLGTAQLSRTAEKESGLVGEHNYAIISLRIEDGRKLMFIKNPWKTRGAEIASGKTTTTSEQFWMSMDQIMQNFESIYLNWNPALFKYRQDIHFDWDLTQSSAGVSIVDDPQFAVKVSKSGKAWLLLSKHFRDKNSKSKVENSHQPRYIGMSIYSNGGHKVMLKGNAILQSPLVDSHQNLLRSEILNADELYTIVCNQADLEKIKYSFTLTVLANSNIELDVATDRYNHVAQTKGRWTKDNAGGNPTRPTFASNPQYELRVDRQTALSVSIEAPNDALAINIKLCHKDGERLLEVQSRDILCDSKDYKKGSASMTVNNLKKGSYILICSTFEAGQLGEYIVYVRSDQPVSMKLLPQDGGGKSRYEFPNAVFHPEDQALAMAILPRRLTSFTAIIRWLSGPDSSNQNSTMKRAMIVQGSAAQFTPIPSSRVDNQSHQEFRNAENGLRTQTCYINPGMAKDSTIWLLIEREYVLDNSAIEELSIEVLTDLPDAVIPASDWLSWTVC